MSVAPPVVELRRIEKRFGPVHALQGVDLELWPGEVVGLLGANGAGKSTLIKVASGIVTPDSGEVLLGGKSLPRHGAIKAAQGSGIAVVPQELNLVFDASVAENILLWDLPKRFGVVAWRTLRNRARAVLAELGVELDVNALTGSLSAVERRLVMVAAAMSQRANVLILDEPTAALPPHEADRVLQVATRVRAMGKTVMFVSHRLDEVTGLVDRALIMREGRLVRELRDGDLTVARMVEELGGKQRIPGTNGSAPGGHSLERGPILMRATGLWGSRIRDVDIEVHAGEILGIAGLVGSGRSELIRLLGGIQRKRAGEIVFGEEASERINKRRRHIGYIDEDRTKNLFHDHDVAANVSLPSLRRFARAKVVRRGRELQAVGEIVANMKIKGKPRSSVAGLSGGNRQKVLLGRWLLSGARILLLDEPTSGLDPVARSEVHELLRGVARDGGAVVVAIAEPSELLELCDLVVVLREGAIVHIEPRPFDERVVLAASYGEH